MAEVVRTPIGPDARLPTRRTLDERIFVRWPALFRALARALAVLPPRARLRRALVRRGFLSGWAAWVRQDLDLMFVRFARDCRYEPAPEMVAAGMRSSYVGDTGMRELTADWLDAFERIELIPQEIVDAGNPIVGLGQARARARSGVELDGPYAEVVWIERGLNVHQRTFNDWDEALEAAGLQA